VPRYEHFVKAFNHALRALHNIDVPLRKSSKLTLLFHRSDPKPITTMHSGYRSDRKPDIVLVFLDAAQNAYSKGDQGTWDDRALGSAADKPKNNFKWRDCLSTAELRRKKKRDRFQAPLAKYPFKHRADEIAPQPKLDAKKSEDPLAEEDELTQPSKGTIQSSASCEPLLKIILTTH
jgi:hypothetical protein